MISKSFRIYFSESLFDLLNHTSIYTLMYDLESVSRKCVRIVNVNLIMSRFCKIELNSIFVLF